MTSASKKLSVLCDRTTHTAQAIHQTAEDLERLAKSPSTPLSLRSDIRHHASRLFSVASRLMVEVDNANPDHVIIRMLTEMAKYALVATTAITGSVATGAAEGWSSATIEKTIQQTDELVETCDDIDEPVDVERIDPAIEAQATEPAQEEKEKPERGDAPASEVDLPTAEMLRRQLRIALVSARAAAEMTQKAAAQELDWSVSKIARIEQGMVSISLSDVRVMLTVYGVSDTARIEELLDLARSAREAKSWAQYDDIMTPAMRDMVGQEHAAASIFNYEPSIVPTLFQTVEYTIEVLHSSGMPSETAYRWAEVHSMRRRLLDMRDRPELNVVLGEAALRRQVGSGEVMREQIRYLIELSSKPGIELYLLPFTAGAHAGMDSQFIVHQFVETDLDDSLYLEDGLKKTTSSEDPNVVQEFLERFILMETKAQETGDFAMHAERVIRENY